LAQQYLGDGEGKVLYCRIGEEEEEKEDEGFGSICPFLSWEYA